MLPGIGGIEVETAVPDFEHLRTGIHCWVWQVKDLALFSSSYPASHNAVYWDEWD